MTERNTTTNAVVRNNPQRNLNPVALIFGGFWFICKGFVGTGLIFLILELCAVGLGAIFCDQSDIKNFIFFFILWRFFLAWFYEKMWKWKQNKKKKMLLEVYDPEHVNFMRISKGHFLYYSLLSMGIYCFYWFFKNLEEIANKRQLPADPLVESLIFPFLAIFDINKILEKEYNRYGLKKYAFLFLFFYIAMLAILNYGFTLLSFIVFMLLILLLIFIIYMFQKAINKIYDGQNSPVPFRTPDEEEVAVMMISFFISSFFYMAMAEKFLN